MTTAIGNSAELHDTGETVGGLASVGSLSCVECGYALSLGALDRDLPRCPACGGSRFKRAAMFERPTVDAIAVDPDTQDADWLVELRGTISEPGRYLAFQDGGEVVLMPLSEGWTRIGRSRLADLRLDDPTVSRRHALVVLTADGDLRALDDRSLNGLFVNGVRMDWTSLGDGDELEIGRYRLHVIDV